MIRKSGSRFSEKITLKQKDRADDDSEETSSCSSGAVQKFSSLRPAGSSRELLNRNSLESKIAGILSKPNFAGGRGKMMRTSNSQQRTGHGAPDRPRQRRGIPRREDRDRQAVLLLHGWPEFWLTWEGVGPPDAIKTGGPVSRHCNSGREGRLRRSA
jgi:hypothetical protein